MPQIAVLSPSVRTEARHAAAEAETGLTRFDTDLGSRVAAFAPVLLRSETTSTSQIENLTASARAILRAELGLHRSRNADEIAANTHTMRAALDLATDLSVESVQELHAVLMEAQPRHTPGRWCDQPVWIGVRSDLPLGATYAAPHNEHIDKLVIDLTEFISDLTVPSLISVAVGHAQFETIHPFSDGNGHVGRALAQAMMRHRGVNRNMAVPVSAGLLNDIEGDHNARQLVAEIDKIRQSWDQCLSARRHSNAWKLLDTLARRLVLNSAAAVEELGVKQPNVYPPLKALVETGIVKSKAEHKLGPFWRSDEVLAAVDAFAERASLRSVV